MPFDRDMSNEIVLGAHVYTQEGVELGTVAETAPHAFRVDVALHPDYWLSTDYVRVASPMEVRLSVDRQGLDAIKRKQPTSA